MSGTPLSRIEPIYSETRVYTPGRLARAQSTRFRGQHAETTTSDVADPVERAAGSAKA